MLACPQAFVTNFVTRRTDALERRGQLACEGAYRLRSGPHVGSVELKHAIHQVARSALDGEDRKLRMDPATNLRRQGDLAERFSDQRLQLLGHLLQNGPPPPPLVVGNVSLMLFSSVLAILLSIPYRVVFSGLTVCCGASVRRTVGQGPGDDRADDARHRYERREDPLPARRELHRRRTLLRQPPRRPGPRLDVLPGPHESGVERRHRLGEVVVPAVPLVDRARVDVETLGDLCSSDEVGHGHSPGAHGRGTYPSVEGAPWLVNGRGQGRQVGLVSWLSTTVDTDERKP